MKDRFTQASTELTDNNPYICTTCETRFGHPTIGHVDDNMDNRRGYEISTRGSECILNCDPMPFGD